MNHHLAKTYRRRRAIVIAVVLIFGLFFLMQKGLLRGLGTVFTKVITPIWQAENFTADYLSITLSSKHDLWKQNLLLKEMLQKKEIQLSLTENLEAENAHLKEVLGRISVGRQVVLSAILAKPNQTPYDTLIIDRGKSDGLQPDDLVFVDGNVLIGEIESVETNSARVLMYSTPGNISQVILGDTGHYFNAHGLGNGTYEVEVSRGVEVKEGDMFFYPGLDSTIVGIARKIEFDPRDSFKKVIMKSPVNIQDRRWVEVRI